MTVIIREQNIQARCKLRFTFNQFFEIIWVMQKILSYFFKSNRFLQQVVILLACILFSGSLAILVGQDLNFDLLQYHFYNGYALLHHRLSKDLGAAMIQTYINPFFDVINYLFIIIQHPKITEFLLGSFTGISGFFLYKISMLFFADYSHRRIYTLYSIIIGMSGAASLSLLNTTTNDTKMSLLIILALFGILKSSITSKPMLYIALASFCIGLTAGLKLPAACYALSLFFTFFLTGKFDKQHILQCGLFVLLTIAGFLVSNGYWMLALIEQFQNPFFPYYNNVFHSAYAPFISFNLHPTKETLFFYHYLFFFYFLAVKSNLAAEVSLREPRLLALFILGCLVSINYFYKNKIQHKNIFNRTEKKLQSNFIKQFLIVFFIISYVLCVLCFAVYRYMLTLEWLSGLLIVYSIVLSVKSFRLQCAILSLLFIFLVSTTLYPDWYNRHKYKETYLSVTLPAIPSDSIILLTTVPIAYIIPFFPESTQFIGMPFVDVGIKDVTQEQINKRKIVIDTMQKIASEIKVKSIYTLSYQQEDVFTEKSQKVLNYFGMKQSSTNCQFLKTNLIGKLNTLKLCVVTAKN